MATVTCVSCGGVIPESSSFCSTCGAAVLRNPNTAETVVAPTPRPISAASSSRPPISRLSSSKSPGDSRFLPGTLIAGRYRIVALLGKGGMGEVYRADDLTLAQEVALKFLPDTLARDEAALSRFRSEVRVARQVSHPNVCRVYDIGEVDGHLFLSMEYVDGEDLGSLIRRIGRLPADKAVEVARKLCAGLAAAHEKGVLHRDLKPGNVMLDSQGQVLLTDFGLAALAGEIAPGEVRSGTPAYMAPEQLAGREVTVRSDIYSLGLVLYEVLTGKRPFEADTLAELLRVRSETTPASPSSLVRDLDPAVERVILRCLDPDPERRPASALAIAAALPGGDPLAAALAAGETPSPQMVAAAGGEAGLSPRIAVPVFAAIIVCYGAVAYLAHSGSALEKIRPPFSPEVLTQKARDIVTRLGYTDPPVDEATGFYWRTGYFSEVQKTAKPRPRWDQVLSRPPSLLNFWYRLAQEPLSTMRIHDDLLTPGIVSGDDPELVQSGMISVSLDDRGRLIEFLSIPPQLAEPAKQPVLQPDWTPLFTAAGLNQSEFQPTEPLWNSLASSDARAAWTGNWPGTERPLRVEAAAWRGKAVFFSLIGSWTKPDRQPASTKSAAGRANDVITVTLVFVLIAVPAWLARRNFVQGKGDRQGAMRLARWMFLIHLALYPLRAHFSVSVDVFGILLIAISTSLFYAAVFWILYLALEPFVRRHWPHSIISWSRILAGRVRDPIVGRDVLFGAALGAVWSLLFELRYLPLEALNTPPNLNALGYLEGARASVASMALMVPEAARGALIFFFLMFLFRVLLRKQWLAGTAFTLLWVGTKMLSSNHLWLDIPSWLLVYALAAFVIVRFGLVALAAGMFVIDTLANVPVTADPSVWYFPSTLLVLGVVLALTTWAFHTSLAGRKLWNKDLFE